MSDDAVDRFKQLAQFFFSPLAALCWQQFLAHLNDLKINKYKLLDLAIRV